MSVLEALTRLVVGMSRLGDHLLSRKVSGIVVASLAFACGAGLAHALKGGPRPSAPACAAPLIVEVRTQNERGEFDSFEYETCRGEASAGGRYENDAYGFSVALPRGAYGAGTPPPPTRTLSFGLEVPHTAGWGGRLLDDAVQNRLSLLRAQGENVRLLSRTLTSLGGLPAARVVATYEKGGEVLVSDEIVAFRRDAGGRASVVYTIDLSTRLGDYERDRPALEEMRQTWHLQPPR